jgi:hypothetical protein
MWGKTSANLEHWHVDPILSFAESWRNSWQKRHANLRAFPFMFGKK